MGATPFFQITDSYSPRLGYDNLVADAIAHHGDDPYNGTISTCQYAGVVHSIATDYAKGAEQLAAEYVECHDNGKKWEARVIDLGIVEYQVLRYKAVKQESNRPKFQPRFAIVDEFGGKLGGKTFESVTEAKRAMADMVSKFDIPPFTLSVVKEYALTSGNPVMAKRELISKSYKRRPKQIPEGAFLKTVHRYAYFGWAGC